MINKIRRFLLRQSGITFFKKNESGSEYYKVKDCLIRLSNHRASAPCPAQNLDIIVNEDMFVVFWLGQLETIRTYDELKERIKTYVRDGDKINKYISARMAVIRNSIKQSTEKVVENIVYVISPNSNLPIIDEESKTVEYLGYRVNCSILRPKTWNSLKSTLINSTPKTSTAFDKVISSYSLKKEKI